MAHFAVFKHDGQSGRSSTPLTANHVNGLYNGGFVYDYSARHPKKDDLIGYWKLDEDISDPGTTQITDYSGEGNHLDTIGSAITEDSTSGLYEKRDVDFTFSFWLKRPVQGASEVLQTVIHKNNEYFIQLGGGTNNRRVRLWRYDRTLVDGGATDFASWNSSNTFLNNDTNWQHVAIKYDASARTMYFYRNGTLVTTDTTPSDADYNESEEF